MKTLLILNDAPYGTERAYNGVRLAGALSRGGHEVRIFLVGDAVAAAHKGQKVPAGFYNLEVMLGAVIRSGGAVGVCGTCMNARGLAVDDLVAGAHRSSMDELAEWSVWADKALVF
ncbi:MULTISPECIES: DsrE family protein [Burkholderia]|uniref:DsrE family protein n=2 Tax=Burkholderia humptydooensis TaxID=430531 RepID=A0A7U4SSQ1_9BURK|nr:MULTISPECIES: DsrE family protein [Burkholderia]AGK48581.1 dsrE/DsrF-like family protein [Burkholderia thailandensis MSMB121]ATF34282.1 hypothetical protein CO709_12900 [Burkholderia thailandensis]AJY40741.1 dsrE/DsrF-like family protein [Burkholderia sp. 2002721687]ALX43058.1 hypothetical protein AQ610_12010 [Burkholderia humptydooensis]EIP87331.1 DsrE-like protein [Burkholderia humptydooensis MSMB43]